MCHYWYVRERKWVTANFTPHTNPYSGPDLALTYWTGVVVDVELLPALELVRGVPIVV